MRSGHLATISLSGAVLLTSLGAAPPPEREVAWHLPGPVAYEQQAGSEGRVLFDHATHLAFLGARCTICHPGTFSILGRSGSVSHEVMNAGGSCGACHDGERAPATDDDRACATCHAGWGAREPVMLRDVPMSGDDSPGIVVFRHGLHAGAGLSCAGCHPDPFALELAGTPVVAAREGGHERCMVCHDGEGAFDLEAASCDVCHQEEVP